MKLTKRVIDHAEHDAMIQELDAKLSSLGKVPGDPNRDVLIWDDQLAGFGVRITASGVKSYLVQYRDRANKTRRVTIGRHGVVTAEQARSQAQQLLAAVARGENPAEEKIERKKEAAEEPTIEDLSERYLHEWAEVRKGPKGIADDTQKLETYIKPTFEGQTVASITREDVARLQHKLRDKPTQANRTVALLSKMMNLAELWGWRPDGSNPCRHLGKFKEKKRERYLSEKELARLGEALREMERLPATPTMMVKTIGRDGKERTVRRKLEPEHPAAILALRLLLLTGARLGEILTLKWEHVDFQRGLLRLPDSKTGAKVIVLGPPAIKLLSEAKRKKGSPWVCPGERGPDHIADLNGPWRRLKAKVDGIQDKEQAEGKLEKKDRVDLSTLRIHDLRHSFASVGAGDGLSLPMIGALLGHTQAQTTARYAHLANDPLRQAAGIVAGHIAAVLEGKPAAEVVEMPLEEAAQ
jgi:integrase